MESANPRYRRVLLKLSGEMLAGPQQFGIHLPTLRDIATEVASAHSAAVQVAVVIGGGNIFRGVAASAGGMERSAADYMGMIATLLNCIAMQDALEKMNVPSRLMTALEMKEVAEPFIRRRALRHMEKGRVVVLAGGTGNPYFSTDTAAALRAAELQADVILKATKVDGVYDRDPMKFKDAVRLPDVTYQEVLARQLKVMDATAVSLCMENRLPIIVFSLGVRGNVLRAVTGEEIGTTVHA